MRITLAGLCMLLIVTAAVSGQEAPAAGQPAEVPAVTVPAAAEPADEPVVPATESLPVAPPADTDSAGTDSPIDYAGALVIKPFPVLTCNCRHSAYDWRSLAPSEPP